MLKIGDYALHQQTGQIGEVFAYGHQILNGTYITTLKVRLINQRLTCPYRRFMEDVFTSWIWVETT